jgi:hypothetical protein
MATLILGALGTALGGPLGGALGALAGRQIDGRIIGSGRREGPRLKDLAITTSTYGQPIARPVGRMRIEGTIIWATDLQERSESSGGKGQPKTKSYSYSISLAVMLASHPIDAIGRIWADGNLLRGAAGDLKTGGAMRLHSGHGDQRADSLMQAALGSECPANRGRAYVVFEDLQLEDFGNRIPALSFEVFAGSGNDALAALLQPVDGVSEPGAGIAGLEGFVLEGGPITQSLALFDHVERLIPDTIASPLQIRAVEDADPIRDLAEPFAAPEGDFGRATGTRRRWQGEETEAIAGLRYYDVGRNYQPGVQRQASRAPSGPEILLEFPAALSSQAARALAERVAGRRSEERERLYYRTAELDPALGPGTKVSLVGSTATWLVEGWEWRETGVELELVRYLARAVAGQPASPGSPWLPLDRLPGATMFMAFELPWDGLSQRGTVYAALAAEAGRWSGATIYADRGGVLVPLATAGAARAVIGTLLTPLGPSSSLMLEETAQLTVRLADPAMVLVPTTRIGIANGENRLLLGEEILQFLDAVEPVPGEWILTGLLRGRGGSEGAALDGHASGSALVLLDERLVSIDPALLGGEITLAALGSADVEPVETVIALRGASDRPPCPVHPHAGFDSTGALALRWVRRARGTWRWLDSVDVPLVEERERYEVGCGPVANPLAIYETQAPKFTVDTAMLAALPPGTQVWVRQIGTYARSPALLLATLN